MIIYSQQVLLIVRWLSNLKKQKLSNEFQIIKCIFTEEARPPDGNGRLIKALKNSVLHEKRPNGAMYALYSALIPGQL